MEPKNKYRITDQTGSEMFLDAIKVIPDDNEDKLMQQENALLQKRKRKAAVIIVSAFIFIIAIGSIIFYYIQNTRSREIEINTILKRAELFETQMKFGNSKVSYYEDVIRESDSILKVLDKLIKKYPEEDTLKFEWVDVFLHKYEKYIHYSLKSNLFDQISNTDSESFEIARKYKPEYTDIISVMKGIPQFYKFKRLYPDPPVLTEIAPQKTLVDSLIADYKSLENIFKNQSSFIEVHFPLLYSWIEFTANYVIPEVFDWQNFWQKFEKALDPLNSKVTSETIFQSLKKDFPNLEILKTNMLYDINNVNEYSIGISRQSVYPPNSTLNSQWYPWIQFFKEKYGINLIFKIYDNNTALYNALQDQEIDFAVLDIPYSTIAFYTDAGTPIACRVWRNEFYVNDIIFTSQKSINTSTQLSNGKVGFYGNDYYEFLRYFDVNKINVDLSKYSFIRYETLDSMIIGLKNGHVDILTISEEEANYLGNENLIKYGFKNVGNIGTSPLGIIWARKSLLPEHILRFQGIIIPIPASVVFKNNDSFDNFPYSDWEIYNQDVMNTYMIQTRQTMLKYNMFLNKLHIVSSNDELDSVNTSVSKNLAKYLNDEGFMVINHFDNSEKIKINEDEQYIKIKSKIVNNKYHYDFSVLKKYKASDSLKYHETFEVGKENMPPDFRHIVFDLNKYISLFAKVEKISGTKIELSSNIDAGKFMNETIKFYRKDTKDKLINNIISIGKVVSVEGDKIIVILSVEDAKKIKIGDIGEINYD